MEARDLVVFPCFRVSVLKRDSWKRSQQLFLVLGTRQRSGCAEVAFVQVQDSSPLRSRPGCGMGGVGTGRRASRGARSE